MGIRGLFLLLVWSICASLTHATHMQIRDVNGHEPQVVSFSQDITGMLMSNVFALALLNGYYLTYRLIEYPEQFFEHGGNIFLCILPVLWMSILIAARKLHMQLEDVEHVTQNTSLIFDIMLHGISLSDTNRELPVSERDLHVNIINSYHLSTKKSLLHAAVIGRNIHNILLLLQQGAYAHACDIHHQTPLDRICAIHDRLDEDAKRHSERIIDIMLAHGASPHREHLSGEHLCNTMLRIIHEKQSRDHDIRSDVRLLRLFFIYGGNISQEDDAFSLLAYDGTYEEIRTLHMINNTRHCPTAKGCSPLSREAKIQSIQRALAYHQPHIAYEMINDIQALHDTDIYHLIQHGYTLQTLYPCYHLQGVIQTLAHVLTLRKRHEREPSTACMRGWLQCRRLSVATCTQMCQRHSMPLEQEVPRNEEERIRAQPYLHMAFLYKPDNNLRRQAAHAIIERINAGIASLYEVRHLLSTCPKLRASYCDRGGDTLLHMVAKHPAYTPVLHEIYMYVTHNLGQSSRNVHNMTPAMIAKRYNNDLALMYFRAVRAIHGMRGTIPVHNRGPCTWKASSDKHTHTLYGRYSIPTYVRTEIQRHMAKMYILSDKDNASKGRYSISAT